MTDLSQPQPPLATGDRPSTAALLEVAVRAARRAGDHALRHRARRTETLLIAQHDIKLALDVECQALAAETIADAFPAHGLLGEEGAPTATLPEWHWVVDPIDGTVNFAHGQAVWCCSIAARRGETVLAGAVYAPELDRLYTATHDGPACCNGRRLQVSDIDRLDRAIVQTGADKSSRPEDQPFRYFAAIAAKAQRPRISGSAALDLCEVARGGAEAYFEPGIFIWDVAAASLILERAGGCCAVLWRDPRDPHRMAFVGANRAALRDALKALVEPLLPEP